MQLSPKSYKILRWMGRHDEKWQKYDEIVRGCRDFSPQAFSVLVESALLDARPYTLDRRDYRINESGRAQLRAENQARWKNAAAWTAIAVSLAGVVAAIIA